MYRFTLAFVMVVVAMQATPAAARPLFGFNEDWLSAGHHLSESRPFSPTTQRLHLNWASIEPVQGHYDWTVFDGIYHRMMDEHTPPIALVLGAPCWAAEVAPCLPGKGYPVRPSHLVSWQRFVEAAVRRYRGLIALEVWNEPNFGAFYTPRPNVNGYVQILRHAYMGSKAARPRLKVLGGSLAPLSNRHRVRRDGGFARRSASKHAYGPFLNRMLELGAAHFMDGLAFHPYPNFAPYLKSRKVSKRVRKGFVPGIRADLKKQLVTVRRIQRRHRAEMPIWATETGICTTGPRERKTSQMEQAKGLRQTYLTLRRLGVSAILFHRLWDVRIPGRPVENIENGCGLIDMNGKRKSAWQALSAVRQAQ